MKQATQENLDAFTAQLTVEYTELFKTPLYKQAASKNTPAALARKIALGLDSGVAMKDGEGVKRTCKHLGIAHTYTAIRAFLNEK